MSRIAPTIPNEKNPRMLKKPAIPSGNGEPFIIRLKTAKHCNTINIHPIIIFVLFFFIIYIIPFGSRVKFSD